MRAALRDYRTIKNDIVDHITGVSLQQVLLTRMAEDFMLIIEQSEADEETALVIAATDKQAEADAEAALVIAATDEPVSQRPAMANVPIPEIKRPPMKSSGPPKEFVALMRDRHPQRGDGSFVIEYNWNIPQYESDPRILKHIIN